MDKKELVERLKTLENRPELESGFASQKDAVRWASEAAPLLQFNGQYYQEFRYRAQRLALKLSADFQISNIERMQAIIHEAITDLEADVPRTEDRATREPLEWPEHVTLAWLWNHVPSGAWASLIGAFAVVFGLGVTVGRSDWYDRVMSPHTSNANTPGMEKGTPLDEPKQRHLTDSQKEQLLNALRPLAASIPNLMVFTEGTPEQMRYAWDFMDVLKRSGIEIIGPLQGVAESPTDKGVMVGVPNPDHPSELNIRFANALRAAGLEVHFTKGASQLPTEPIDFDLLIGR